MVRVGVQCIYRPILQRMYINSYISTPIVIQVCGGLYYVFTYRTHLCNLSWANKVLHCSSSPCRVDTILAALNVERRMRCCVASYYDVTSVNLCM